MSVQCQVHRLRIRGASDEQARYHSFLVEDALRTASFPTIPPNSLILIRRLDLGRTSRRATSVALSRRIDARLLDIRPVRVTGGSPEHPEAPAIWFRDELEPLILCAGLLAAGRMPRSWYWERVIRGWRPGMAPCEWVRLVLRAVGATAIGPVGLVRFGEALVAEGTLTVFLALTSADDLPAICLSTLPSAKSGVTAFPAPILPALPDPWRTALIRQVARHGISDGRTLWLARLAVLATLPAADDYLVHRVLDELAALAASSPLRPGDPAVGAYRQTSAPSTDGPVDAEGPRTGAGDTAALAARDTDSGEHAPPVTPGQRSRTAGEPAASFLAPPETPDHIVAERPALLSALQDPVMVVEAVPDQVSYRGEPSPHGGFLFLVPLLLRLDIQETIDAYPALPALNLPVRVLRAVAARLGIADDDPILAVVPRAELMEVPVVFSPPPRWAGLFPVPTGSVIGIEEAVWGWQVAMARFLRRHARLTLGALVRRPGLVAVTRTHLDVTYAGDQVDLRIRRIGLDLDPGWVSWLGRVVSFHYLYPENP